MKPTYTLIEPFSTTDYYQGAMIVLSHAKAKDGVIIERNFDTRDNVTAYFAYLPGDGVCPDTGVPMLAEFLGECLIEEALQ